MTDKTKTPFAHIGSAKELLSGPDKCKTCKVDLEAGYGLAGGGYGPYMYCPRCGMITDKIQDPT